jgi:hypothetical protein
MVWRAGTKELGPEGIDGYLDAMSIAVSPGA